MIKPRKMFRFTSCLLGSFIILFSITNMEAIRFHFPSPQFEFFHPRGLTIWYPELQGVVGFDIKIYLNKPYLHDYTLYDMYLNTSTVSYGKFIVNDDDAFIRLGDNLRYEVNLQYSDGNKYRIRRWFTVKENPIFRLKVPPKNRRNDTKEGKVNQLKEEINQLEGIMDDLIKCSSNGSEVSNNLFLNFRPASVILDSKQLLDHTLDVLQKEMPKVNWKFMLTRAFYYNNGVGFEVKTMLDKLKILQMFKTSVKLTITDLDKIDKVGYFDDDYDEDSPFMLHRFGKPEDT